MIAFLHQMLYNYLRKNILLYKIEQYKCFLKGHKKEKLGNIN